MVFYKALSKLIGIFDEIDSHDSVSFKQSLKNVFWFVFSWSLLVFSTTFALSVLLLGIYSALNVKLFVISGLLLSISSTLVQYLFHKHPRWFLDENEIIEINPSLDTAPVFDTLFCQSRFFHKASWFTIILGLLIMSIEMFL